MNTVFPGIVVGTIILFWRLRNSREETIDRSFEFKSNFINQAIKV